MRTQVVCTEMLGRDSESAELDAALERAHAAEPSTVLIGGEAGIGKSRLLTEFTGAHAAHTRVLLGGCVELGADGLPFAPFVAALRGLSGELTEQERAELAPLLPVGARTGAPVGDDARPRLFEALLAVLSRLAEQRSTVLIIEDMHWADRSSRDLLDFLVRNQQAAPGSMIIVTHRSDELARGHPLRPLLAELGRLTWVSRTELRRLSEKDVSRQVRGILDHEPAPELVHTIYRRSEGNPLFVEALLDCGDPAAGTLPASLQDWLLSKLDELPANVARVVRVAAAGSHRIGHAMMATVSGLDEPDLSQALRSAVEANVLLVDGDDYLFRHALFRDAVYGTLLPGERIDLHGRYAAALLAAPELSGHQRCSTELAHHLYAAKDSGGAMSAAWTAAREAQRSLAYAEQLQMLERVLELWDTVADRVPDLGVDYPTVLEKAAEAAGRAGEYSRGEELATALLHRLDPSTELVRSAMALELRARMRTQLGMAGSAEDHREAVRLTPEDHPARGYLLNALAARLMEIPRPAEAREVAEQALAAAQRGGDGPTVASALITLAVLDARAGELDAQLPMLAKARAIAENIGAPRVRLRALHAESHLLQAYGRLDEAERVARAGLAAARDHGLARAEGGRHAVDLAGCLVSSGRWDDALESIAHALSLTPSWDHQAHLLCFKAFIALQRGDFELPERAIARSAALLTDGTAFTQDPLLAQRLELELRLMQGNTADAMTVLRRALRTPQLAQASRFTWPLLVLGARVATTAADPGLLDELRAVAAEVRVAGPVQRAGALTFTAEAARAAGQGGDPHAWQHAVQAWQELAQPLRLARAELGHAEAVLGTGGNRRVAEVALRHAVTLATELGATPLRNEIGDLARRARLPVAVPASGTSRAAGTDPAHVPGVGDGRHDTRRSGAPEGREESYGLTPRELDILRLITEGLGNKDIAGRLFISAKTASVHVSNVLGKLGVSNRVEAAAVAHRLGLSTGREDVPGFGTPES